MASVTPYGNFDAEKDCIALRDAMKGLGTDEKAIIDIITKRSNKQRQELIVKYKQSFGKDLVDDLKSELSGHFEDVVVAMFMKPRDYDVYSLHKAMKGAGTKESTLIEILVSRDNKEIDEIKEIYKKKHGKTLEDALKGDTSGHFKRLLVSLGNGARDTDCSVDEAKAAADAKSLYEAGEKKWGTDESTFNLVLATRSFPQLRATFEAYKKLAGKDIKDSIKSEFSGDIEDGLLAVVESAESMAGFFAKSLYKSMKGLGTDDQRLIRIVVSRSEVDMEEIKLVFKAMYKKDLGKFIHDDTSGDYRKILLELVN